VARLKGNLHAHTTISDGRNTYEEMLKAYYDAGYDFVAFTDHRRAPVPYYYPTPKYDIVVFGGVEVTRPEMHYTLVVGDFEILTFLNHPQRHFRTWHEACKVARRLGFGIMEVTDHGNPVKIGSEYLKELGVGRMATDDAHSVDEVGKAWIEVDVSGVEAYTLKDAILRAIKLGQYKVVIK